MLCRVFHLSQVQSHHAMGTYIDPTTADKVSGRVRWSPAMDELAKSMQQRLLVVLIHGRDVSGPDRRTVEQTMSQIGGVICGGVKNQPNIHVKFSTAEDATAALTKHTEAGKNEAFVTVAGKALRLRRFTPADLPSAYTLTLNNVSALYRHEHMLRLVVETWGTASNIVIIEDTDTPLQRTAGDDRRRVQTAVMGYTPHFDPAMGVEDKGADHIIGMPGGYSGNAPRCIPDIITVPQKYANARGINFITTQVNYEDPVCVSCFATREHISKECPERSRAASAKQKRYADATGTASLGDNRTLASDRAKTITAWLLTALAPWDAVAALEIPRTAQLGLELTMLISYPAEQETVLCPLNEAQEPYLPRWSPTGAVVRRGPAMPLDMFANATTRLRDMGMSAIVTVDSTTTSLRARAIEPTAAIRWHTIQIIIPCTTTHKKGDALPLTGCRWAPVQLAKALAVSGIDIDRFRSLTRPSTGAPTPSASAPPTSDHAPRGMREAVQDSDSLPTDLDLTDAELGTSATVGAASKGKRPHPDASQVSSLPQGAGGPSTA
eukprot:jgi/Mesvir1/14682/Mv26253-RA.1